MFELVVLMTYLARAWKLLDGMQHAGYPIPLVFQKELKALSGDLTALFADPSHVLNPVVVKLAEAEKAAAEVEPAPAVQPVECPGCGGKGTCRSRFLGAPDCVCSVCGGSGEIGSTV